jgi:hypothetical protein
VIHPSHRGSFGGNLRVGTCGSDDIGSDSNENRGATGGGADLRGGTTGSEEMNDDRSNGDGDEGIGCRCRC